MRTTLTLDEDIAAKLKAETRRSGKSFKQLVNDLLRIALNSRRQAPPQRAFKIEARDLGRLKPGLSLDNVGELLEHAEGPGHR